MSYSLHLNINPKYYNMIRQFLAHILYFNIPFNLIIFSTLQRHLITWSFNKQTTLLDHSNSTNDKCVWKVATALYMDCFIIKHNGSGGMVLLISSYSWTHQIWLSFISSYSSREMFIDTLTACQMYRDSDSSGIEDDSDSYDGEDPLTSLLRIRMNGLLTGRRHVTKPDPIPKLLKKLGTNCIVATAFF